MGCFLSPYTNKKRLPRRLDEEHIVSLGQQVALFHKACHSIRNTLPPSSKTLNVDVDYLLKLTETDDGKYEYRMNLDKIKQHSSLFIENSTKLGEGSFNRIPVFVDWNIGNFPLLLRVGFSPAGIMTGFASDHGCSTSIFSAV
jgi:hypothetical protein